MRALRAARDKAERAWREAKSPAPLPTRLGWAEAKLDKAAAALTKARLAVEELDAEYERRREDLHQRLHKAEGWHKWRQQQLDELHDEAADRAPSRRRATESAGGAEVRSKIRDQLLPQVQLVMEHLEGNPEILDQLSLVAAGLIDAESRLEVRPTGGTVETFDIAEGDHDELGWGSTGQAAANRDGADGTKGGKGKSTEWKPEGSGRWTRVSAKGRMEDAVGTTTSRAASSGTDAHPRRGLGENDGTTSEARGSDVGKAGKDDGLEEAPAANGEECGNPSKHRRRQSEEEAKEEARLAADRRRAEELHQQQAAAVAAQVNSFNAGAGGFGSEAALFPRRTGICLRRTTCARTLCRQGH